MANKEINSLQELGESLKDLVSTKIEENKTEMGETIKELKEDIASIKNADIKLTKKEQEHKFINDFFQAKDNMKDNNDVISVIVDSYTNETHLYNEGKGKELGTVVKGNLITITESINNIGFPVDYGLSDTSVFVTYPQINTKGEAYIMGGVADKKPTASEVATKELKAEVKEVGYLTNISDDFKNSSVLLEIINSAERKIHNKMESSIILGKTSESNIVGLLEVEGTKKVKAKKTRLAELTAKEIPDYFASMMNEIPVEERHDLLYILSPYEYEQIIGKYIKESKSRDEGLFTNAPTYPSNFKFGNVEVIVTNYKEIVDTTSDTENAKGPILTTKSSYKLMKSPVINFGKAYTNDNFSRRISSYLVSQKYTGLCLRPDLVVISENKA